MSHYTITYHNKENGRLRSQSVQKLTFEEATVFANIEKRKMGNVWEISSISKSI